MMSKVLIGILVLCLAFWAFYIGVQYGYRTKGKQKISLWLSYSKDQITLQRLRGNGVIILHQSMLLPDKAAGTKITLTLD